MTKENTIKNYGKSIRTKLLNVAKQEGVFYQTILTRYFHTSQGARHGVTLID